MSARRASLALAQPLRFGQFSGGESAIFPPTMMKPQYALLLENVYITDAGGVGKIPGYVRQNAESCGVSLTSGYEFKQVNGTTTILVAGGGSIFRWTGTTLTPIKTGLDPDAVVRFNTFKDLCIMTNGVEADGVLKYDGTTVSALGVTPVSNTVTGGTTATLIDTATDFSTAGMVAGASLTYTHSSVDYTVEVSSITTTINANDTLNFETQTMAPAAADSYTVKVDSPPPTAFKSHTHKGRVWYIERANKLLATHSALDNPSDVMSKNDAGYLDFQFLLPEGDDLLDIWTFVDLIVFCFRQHMAIYSGSTPSGTNSDFQLVQLLDTGVVGTDTGQALGSDIAFLYDSGVKSLRQVVTTGKMNINDVSRHVDPSIRAKIKNNMTGAFSSAHYPRRGWYLMQTADIIWIYSYPWKSWFRLTGADINYMFTTADGKLYFCGRNGFLYLFDDVWAFDGQGYTWRWQTAWLALTRLGNNINLKMMEVFTPAQTAATIHMETQYDMKQTDPACIQDFDIDQSVTLFDDVQDIDALNPVDESQADLVRVPLFGRGRIVSFILTNTSTVGPIEIYDLVLLATQGGF